MKATKNIPIAVDRLDPSMSIETTDVKELAGYDVGDEMEMTAKCKMTSKDMIDEKDAKKGYRCRMTMSNIAISDEIGAEAEKRNLKRKDWKEIIGKRKKEGGE